MTLLAFEFPCPEFLIYASIAVGLLKLLLGKE